MSDAALPIALQALGLGAGARADATVQQNGVGTIPRTAGSWIKELPTVTGFDGIDVSGATASTTGFQQAINSQAGSWIKVPKGTYKITNIAVPATGLVLEGCGEDSVLELGSDNANILSAILGGYLRIYNVRFVGRGSVDRAIRKVNGGNIEIDHCFFDNFGGVGCVDIQSLDGNLAYDISIERCNFTGLKNVIGGENAAILMYGGVRRVSVRGNRIIPAASNPVANGVAIARLAIASPDGGNPELINISDNFIGSVSRRGISVASEVGDATYQGGKLIISSNHTQGTGWSGIKTKNMRIVEISNNIVDAADQAAPALGGSGLETDGNLQGGILLVNPDRSVVTGNIVNATGSDGYRILGNAAGEDNPGSGRSRHIWRGNLVDGALEDGLSIGNYVRNGTFDLLASNCKYGVRIFSSAGNVAPTSIDVSIRARGCSQYGIMVAHSSGGPTIGYIRFHDTRVEDCVVGGASLTNAWYVEFDNAYIVNNSGYGIITGTGLVELKIKNSKIGNVQATSQTRGVRLQSSTSRVWIFDSDLRSNTIASIEWLSAPSLLTQIVNVSGFLEATVNPQDWGSVSLGASLSATVAVSGSLPGDQFDVWMDSMSLQGCTLRGYCGTSGTVTVILSNPADNPAATAVDLASGTMRLRGRRSIGV